MTVVSIVLVVLAVQVLGVVLFRSLARANERFDADGNVRNSPSAATASGDVGDRRTA